MHALTVKTTAEGGTAATVGGVSLIPNPVPAAVRSMGSVPVLGENNHWGIAVNDVVEVVDPVMSVAVNVSGTLGDAVTNIEHVKFPVALVAQDAGGVNSTLAECVAAKVIGVLASKPDPAAVNVAGRVCVVGVNDHDGAAVNVEAVVTPSIVNDCAVSGDAKTVHVQLRSPTAFVVQAPSRNTTAVGVTAANVGGDSLAANPVPVPVSTWGSVSGPLGENVQVGVAVKAFDDVTVFVPSLAVNVSGVSGE